MTTRTLVQRVLVAACVLATSTVACSDDPGIVGLCQSDEQCSKGFSCVNGRCICSNDAACEIGEFCNTKTGSCQKRVGCDNSLDCPPGLFCDRETGNCLDRARCTEDVHCALGEICNTLRYQCVSGCRTVGDCKLGDVCECPGGAASCETGICRNGPCGDNSFCKYGEECIQQTEGDVKRCVEDERGPYCEPCTIGPGQAYCEGDGANYCLVDTSKPYGSYFCGVECAADTECPWGFACHDVLILTEQTCGGAARCPLRQRTCTTDADCRGGQCDPDSGRCRPLCVGGESDVQGFCTCIEDSDCPVDECDATTARCTYSNKPCDPNQPKSCASIYCRQVTDPLTSQEIGYCFIGRNCAPVEGVTCDQVRAR